MLVPRQKTPPLALDTVAHGRFDLDSITAERGVVLCFYRGLHCPLCAKYLTELEKQTPAFAERGVETLALSTDGEERARAMAEKVGVKALRFAYGLSLGEARDWGLYISTGRGPTSIGIEEPERFAEPGVFMVQPGRVLYWASVQSMPFVRPNFAEMVQALDFIIEKNYPARGEYTGAL